MRRVPRHMRSSRRVARRSRRSANGGMAGIMRRVMRGNRCCASRGHADFAAHPSARRFDRLPRPQVLRPCRLKARQYTFRAFRRP